MSFKANIPTLSANEVYTLTFEYEGTETIQLIVGDLTLETTDRRVVFTTTSPVNYIESNVNLINLNIYEGYYESDDFGGEYTQESYIEGKTEIIDNVVKCVKSPRVISREQPLNMFYCTNWTSTLRGGTVTCQDGKFYFDGSFGGYTYFDIINGGEAKNNIYLEPGMYYVKIKAHSKEPCIATGMCISMDAILENGGTIELCGVYTDKNYMYNKVSIANKQITSPIVKLNLKIWYGGNGSSNIIIDGIYLSKTDTTDDLAFKETNIIATPDDLELYAGYDKKGNWYGDKLDLTTGTFYQYYDIWDLATLLSQTNPQTGFSYNADINMVSVQWTLGNTHPSGTVWDGVDYTSALIGNYFEYGYGSVGYDKKTSPYIAFTNRFLYIGGMSYNEIFKGVTITNNQVLNTNEAKASLIQFARDNSLKIGLPLNTPKTKQLSLNVLKSYRNGSIQTSSQQLTPTLKTTLPISNKFTTTNLTSGSTYNVYFDGTATKLDAGGTIITNPISPCEVECGGTTLTIEGTDIQNVRVIETTIKNEVGNNGTSDVELSKIETSDINGENIITSDLEQPIKLRSLGTTYDSYNPVTGELIKRIGVSETDGSYSVLSSPIVSDANKIILGVLTNIRGERIALSNEQRKHDYLLNNCKPNTDYFIIADASATGEIYVGFIVNDSNWSGSSATVSYRGTKIKLKINSGSTPNYLRVFADSCENLMIIEYQDNLENKDIPYFEGTQDVVINVTFETPQLYTNGQVKVYSDSDVYPTTILNGQSTNNYKVNGLNKSNNYTIRYDGTCESINLADKSNTQGTNRIIKAGTTSGNLTFVNNSGDIDNVLLVQGDVREQEINHFTGLQTVEISRILIQNQSRSQYIDLPQPVQLNSLPDGTCDTYNPITGEYIQNVGYTDSTDYDTYYQLVNPITTQLTPITIPTFEGGILQLITTNGKVFPMIEYSMATNNRYDTSSWEAGVVYTQRNMTEAYFNDSTTPMTPTETMTLTTDHISSGSIILSNNGNGLIVLEGNYTGRDIPYFTGMRSVDAIEIETVSSPDQPLFGKGGRK